MSPTRLANVLRGASTRVLHGRDRAAVLDLLTADPVANVMVAARVEHDGLDPWRLGGELWGYFADRRLAAVCLSGANLIPAQAGPQALAAFAERARRQGRRCSSIVGPADQVLGLWGHLQASFGPARDVRPNQPLLALDAPPKVRGDPAVRPVAVTELELLLPAAVAMYTEEIGFSPIGADGGALYRARVQELVGAGRAFARIEDGRVVFKAEVGAVSRQACQVQGVWVDPALRGRGLGTAATAAVVAYAQQHLAPVVSLYVNEHNTAARRSYQRIGFQPAGTFASVLF